MLKTALLYWNSFNKLQRRLAVSAILISAAWAFGELHDRLPNNPAHRYCVQVAKQDRHFWLEVFGFREAPSPYRKVWQDRCMSLLEADLLQAPCEVKQAWLQEEFRHIDARRTLSAESSKRVLSEINMSPFETDEYNFEKQLRPAQLDAVCKLFPTRTDVSK